MKSNNTFDQMDAIILAAGYSSRANDFKMTLHLQRSTVLESTISKFEGICQRVIVVGGFHSEKIDEAVSKISNDYDMEIIVVYNRNFDQGMFSSIQKGCQYLTSSQFFITPGDCPVVSKKTIESLAVQRGDVVIPSYRNKGGHPIKLTSDVKERIVSAKSDSNLRNILQEYEKKYLNVTDPGVLIDIDTPEDYQKVLNYLNESKGKVRL